jgi:putative membrane-bound dehydrogenase-like protein
MKIRASLPLILLPLALHAAPPLARMERDLDRDGKPERIVNKPGATEIQRSGNGDKTTWQLPEGLSFFDAAGNDTGLRLVDLNGDGFDDVLFSDANRYGIWLWNKSVMPHLGWKAGWSRTVRSGRRSGGANEPPLVAGAEVKVEGGELIVTRDGKTTRTPAKVLIAWDMPPARSPQESLGCFHVRPGFRIELAAAEPEVIDPVAFDWDAHGRLWVVEMRDYPLGIDGKGKPGGVVKWLIDANGDGLWEKVTVFADGLRFPTGVFPWRDGVLVAAAPEILFLQDTNGDGRSDKTTVLFTGFTEGNQQHRVNGFEWGLNGWLYGANGDSGGTVRCLATVTGQKPVEQPPVAIRGRDFRFRPDTGEFETVSGMTQYGLRRDDWGRWFGNNNPNWLWTVTMPEHYLRRNPKLAVASVIQMLAPDNRVFAVSAPMQRVNQPESYGHVTSACSPAPYRDVRLGEGFFADSVFICEPVHNAVHREVLREEHFGLASSGGTDEQNREFLASSDHWFRPVMVKTGPDGALWIADMMRFVLEHPEWIAPEDQERLDLRAGSDKGRIWRVVPDKGFRWIIPSLANLSDGDLAGALDSPNGWQRDTVHRLLVERRAKSTAPLLRKLATDPPHPGKRVQPPARVQALAALDSLEADNPDTIRAALRDEHPQVRCQALRSSELMAKTEPSLLTDICALESDESPAVRRQLAFTLGAWPGLTATATLTQMAARDGADPLMRAAILSSVAPDSPLMQQLRGTDAKAQKFSLPKLDAAPNPERSMIAARYLEAIPALKGNAENGREKFMANCAVCHRLKDVGNAIGPDLAMTAMKPNDWLLTAILDPNAAVEARFMVWITTLKRGDPVAGIIAAETANNLAIRSADGQEHTILRSDIKEVTPHRRSLMPEGLEAVLQPQELADLLAWMREKP